MNAWPYRDYLIRSLNSDKPYARFVEEQLAGDVLYPDDAEAIVARIDSDEVMDFINARLAKHPYIVGEKFTAADVLYASAFALFMDSPLLEGKRTQQLTDYVARCVSRPARSRAASKDQPAA